MDKMTKKAWEISQLGKKVSTIIVVLVVAISITAAIIDTKDNGKDTILSIVQESAGTITVDEAIKIYKASKENTFSQYVLKLLEDLYPYWIALAGFVGLPGIIGSVTSKKIPPYQGAVEYSQNANTTNSNLTGGVQAL